VGTTGVDVKEERLLGSSFAVIARILVLTLWLGTDAFETVFNTWIFPLLGLIFLPFTAVVLTIAKSADAGIVVVVMAVGMGIMLDAASAALAAGRKERY
jgi:cell division protein FtsW (lipid II flippase)